MKEGIQHRLNIILNIARFTFHWGFIPTILYLGKDVTLFMVVSIC